MAVDSIQGSDNGPGISGKNSGAAASPPSPLSKPWVRAALAAVVAVVLVGGVVWVFRWWTHGRFVQTTNDAYLAADQVVVSSKVAGTIEEVYVVDNQQVQAGQQLIRIDASASRAKVEQAQAEAVQARADIDQYHSQIGEQEAAAEQARAQREGARAKWGYAAGEVERYRPLADSGAEKPEKLAELISNRDQAFASLHQQDAAVLQALRKIDTLATQIKQSEAKIAQAEAQARQAKVDVDSSLIAASISGRVADRTARIGAYAQAGTRLLTVVPVESLYLNANFKETQIRLMRVGQPARIKIDALDGEELNGRVQSFSPGTGAEFAVIPAMNATGNFTKVVQRVPVRIEFDADDAVRRVLVPGLSVDVSVDTIDARREAGQRDAQPGAGQAHAPRGSEDAGRDRAADDSARKEAVPAHERHG